ncbi:unnamed protein product [Lymnaea stagnalis]|uniref:CUE domain-containing protein 2 n=1 Tax=Lymnaea stagnalis TaxID=6523 RepID=A0AAV2HZA1_LYMST
MEAKVHHELSAFLARHCLEDAIRNIDDIVLSYLVGVVELVSQEDDGLDLEDVTEMMNAYLPGFDLIGREEVIEWMFGLAKQLLTSEDKISDLSCINDVHEIYSTVENISSKHSGSPEKEDQNKNPASEKKFPSYEFSNESKIIKTAQKEKLCFTSVEDPVKSNSSFEINRKTQDLHKDNKGSSNQITFISTPLSSSPIEKQSPHIRSKRKGRQLSCSSQDSQEDKSDVLATEEESHVKTLLEMFPGACTMEARHCLHLSAGNMDRAAQLIMDRQETGQAITGKSKVPTVKNHKVKKVIDYKLDDESIKSCVLQKYSFVDTEEDKKTFRPPPVKGEAKKLVRYRDGQVVSMKGEKFSEVSKKEPDGVKATYVNLKPARKYRFH